jgi:MSHA pilin protein MshD
MCISRQRGLTIIELIISIVVISIALVGVLAAYNTAVKSSADPMVRKQALAIAESMLSEVLQQPYTWCDPQDAAVESATGYASCAVSQAAPGKSPASESRLSQTDSFDNVADYHGYASTAESPAGIYSLDEPGAPLAALSGYQLDISVTQRGSLFGLANDAALRVDVRVRGRGEDITMSSYRFRHAPNAPG